MQNYQIQSLPDYAKYCISENKNLVMTKYKKGEYNAAFCQKENALLIG